MASTAWSFLMLLLVLALIPGVLWLLKRVQTFRPPGAPRELEVTAQVALGARERVVLVRMADRTLVLGVTPQQVTLLAEQASPVFQRERGTP
ncbi:MULTISPECIES: flagellar biosynthetic protein FliO [Ramlibacter]|uniref:Flagellar protein n=1 Tax=Ramlibacter aquaticus TaxID=2780094 RepID=A0ABR9SA38_9BURK|nr:MULTISPECIES: flagellar biosynthetic protein FliO [Ramlibacter]MBE7939220.1 flagellar biosynthetic protein FliO [Ramlibacter aquaticus]